MILDPQRGASVRSGRQGRPTGFTLVELLVAATLALVVMAALASLFGIFGRTVADSQELVQLAGRMRSAAWLLRQDLQGATAEAKPFVRPESAGGYLEIVEGPVIETGTTMIGDIDDVLMLTTSRADRPFTGLLSGTLSLESPVAEVAWFCKLGPQTGGLQLYNLYRRQLLVAAVPGAGNMQAVGTDSFATWGTWDAFYLSNDLSVRREGNLLIPNGLDDLTRRQSRFMRNLGGTVNATVHFNWPMITATASTPTVSGAGEVLTSVREGEDLLLANVIAFDVRVFDPQMTAPATSGLTYGGYLNLGSGTNASTTMTVFSNTAASVLTGTGTPPTVGSGTGAPPNRCFFYDTWSIHTEFNNVMDSSAAQDRGTNLVDDNANGVVDDAGELEQPPPYNVPLRGVEIRIRCYEPSSQEVRQITVQHSFLAR